MINNSHYTVVSFGQKFSLFNLIFCIYVLTQSCIQFKVPITMSDSVTKSNMFFSVTAMNLLYDSLDLKSYCKLRTVSTNTESTSFAYSSSYVILLKSSVHFEHYYKAIQIID